MNQQYMNVVLAPVRPGLWSVRPPRWCPAPRPATNCRQFVRCVIPATTRSERFGPRPTRRPAPSTSRERGADPGPASAISPSIEVSASTRPTNGGATGGNPRPSGGTRRPSRASPRPRPAADGDLLLPGGAGSRSGIQPWTMTRTTMRTLMRLINYPRWTAGVVVVPASVDPFEVPAVANCCKSQCPTG